MARRTKGYYIARYMQEFGAIKMRGKSESLDYTSSEQVNEIINYYGTIDNHDGVKGSQFEVMLRDALKGIADYQAPQGVADIVYKQGVTIECKTGAGRLINTGYETPEKALAAFWGDFKKSGRPMKKASHVAYIPNFTGNIDDVYILYQPYFIRLLRVLELIRTKQYDDGHKVTIQNYLPTKNFNPSIERIAVMKMGLENLGKSLPEFIKHMDK